MARIHRKLYKKDLNDPDNHDGVITHLEPDILECEVKLALLTATLAQTEVSRSGLVLSALSVTANPE